VRTAAGNSVSRFRIKLKPVRSVAAPTIYLCQRLPLEKADKPKRILAHRDAEFVRITIADRGHGIPVACQRNIFTPFFTTKKDVGTGLGLWVTKSMVEKHGGRISFRSQPDRGTVFSILLPRKYVPATTAA
jgi:signal transduction histidine kinase